VTDGGEYARAWAARRRERVAEGFARGESEGRLLSLAFAVVDLEREAAAEDDDVPGATPAGVLLRR
jgi:hypothetical protein